jgi:hypothetical protein
MYHRGIRVPGFDCICRPLPLPLLHVTRKLGCSCLSPLHQNCYISHQRASTTITTTTTTRATLNILQLASMSAALLLIAAATAIYLLFHHANRTNSPKITGMEQDPWPRIPGTPWKPKGCLRE